MSIVGLQGGLVRLIPLDRSIHLENALRWMNDPAVTATLELNFGVTRRQEEAYFDRMEAGTDDDLVWAIHDGDDRHVGLIGLHAIRWRHRSATGGIVIGEPDSWGKGIATDAVRVRTRFAFDELGLQRIEGHTIHPGMRRVYDKAGYRKEGTLREKIWRDGRWRDADIYAILDGDPTQGGGAEPDVLGRADPLQGWSTVSGRNEAKQAAPPTSGSSRNA